MNWNRKWKTEIARGTGSELKTVAKCDESQYIFHWSALRKMPHTQHNSIVVKYLFRFFLSTHLTPKLGVLMNIRREYKHTFDFDNRDRSRVSS